MAVESPIEAAHEFFVGEDKVLTFVMEDAADGIDGWTMTWTLYRHGSDEPVAELDGSSGVTGIPANEANPAVVNVYVPGSATAGLSADDVFRHVLRRVDVPGVLSYGGAVLRDPVTAQ